MTDLIRFHDAASAAEFLPDVRHAFPQVDAGAHLVAVDWQGRQYVQSGGNVYAADLGYGAYDELASRDEWDEAVRDRPAEVFDGELYDRFRAETGLLPDGLASDDCVEFTTPLYLGGENSIANMAVISVRVHWAVGSQIYAQVRDLPPGTPIGNITIEP